LVCFFLSERDGIGADALVTGEVQQWDTPAEKAGGEARPPRLPVVSRLDRVFGLVASW
jgi:hypothetical protein